MGTEPGTSFRRIVTGHDADRRSRIASDAPPVRVFDNLGEEGLVFHEVWNTRQTPAILDRNDAEPAETHLLLAPPPGGTRIRVLDIPPEQAGADFDAVFDAIGGSDAGDIIIQRGTNHGWINRSGAPCRIAFILIDGVFDDDLA